MDKRSLIIDLVIEKGLLPLYFHADAAISLGVLDALYKAGIRAVEYTHRGKEALGNFGKLRSYCDQQLPGLFLGIGTIKDAATARDYVQAGADFLVSPGIPEDVFDIAYSEKILWIPGCMTVTEILLAEKFGIEFIKIFPGTVLGPAFVQAIREIFPELLFMPTGGVSLETGNLRSWFEAGVAAVGMGSKLISRTLMDAGDFGRIGSLASEAIGSIRELRK